MPYDQTRDCRGPAIPTDSRFAPSPCHNCRACALDHAGDVGAQAQNPHWSPADDQAAEEEANRAEQRHAGWWS